MQNKTQLAAQLAHGGEIALARRVVAGLAPGTIVIEVNETKPADRARSSR